MRPSPRTHWAGVSGVELSALMRCEESLDRVPPRWGTAAVPQGTRVLGWPDHRVWLHSSSASPKHAALSPCHHSSHPSLITLSRELHLSPDSVVGGPRQGVELQLFQLSLQITRAPHNHQMAGLEVTASEQQNPNTDEPHEQAHTFPQRAICSCSTNR